jgi:hypothetical protein
VSLGARRGVVQAPNRGGGLDYGWVMRLLAGFELWWWLDGGDWLGGRGGGAVVGEVEEGLRGVGLRLGRPIGREEGWCEEEEELGVLIL